MKKIVFEIHPLSCIGCAKKIEDRFYQQPGIFAINVYGQLGKILVRYEETETNVEQMEHILSELGYPIISKTTA